jgi:TPR repeat protein
MEAENSQAVFMLAQTYDPKMLRSWKTFGIRGDARKAFELYQKAADAGIHDAAAHIEALKTEASGVSSSANIK